ncbi:MAG TPA: AbrB/MazE/SpoVT family DNA-binding domain-containing protein [Steroidobacteraceae bacterium]|jgi:antitoxin VapB|nr:AbrB/MazE/SpoVT family DNA-binding domain-containing protein [Steroidobacteraceae bacterium]
MRRTAKLFVNGGSQAVRLPAEFRFKVSEVFIRRDSLTGEVILSAKSTSDTWSEFFALRDQVDLSRDVTPQRALNEKPPRARGSPKER